jgi:hypothetical protein
MVQNSWQHAPYTYFPNKEQDHKPAIDHQQEQAPPPARRDPGWDDTSDSDYKTNRLRPLVKNFFIVSTIT